MIYELYKFVVGLKKQESYTTSLLYDLSFRVKSDTLLPFTTTHCACSIE